MAQPARQISKGKLLQLHKAAENCTARVGEERQALGAKFEAAATSDNFNAKAYKAIRPLLKMDPGPQAHLWRTMCLYAEHFGVGTQGDLEDEIARQEARDASDNDGSEDAAEAAADVGEGDDGDDPLAEDDAGDPVADVLAGMDTPELGRFRTAIGEALTIEAVNAGLERFTEDHPTLAEAALSIAQARLEAINAEAGGGEDLRSTATQEAEKESLAQNAEATAKAAGDKPKRASRKRTTAAAGDPAEAFGAAGGSVH